MDDEPESMRMNNERGHLPEGLCVSTKKEVCCNVKCESEEEITDVQGPSICLLKINSLLFAVQRSSISNGFDKRLKMLFETMQVADSVFGELWPKKLSTAVPLRPISRKDAVAQELSPFIPERLAFAKIGELRGEHSFDVFRLMSKYNTLHENAAGDGRASRSLEDHISPELKICVGYGVSNTAHNKIEACSDLAKMIIDAVHVVCVSPSGSLW